MKLRALDPIIPKESEPVGLLRELRVFSVTHCNFNA